MLKENDRIYGPVWGTHLGDCILSINYLVNTSYDLNRHILISDHYNKVNKKKYCYAYYDIQNLILEKDRFTIVKDDGNFSDYEKDKYVNRKFIANKYQFDRKNVGSNLVAYQFDAKGKRSLFRRFPSIAIENFVIKSLQDMGFHTVRLGYPLTLEQDSEILSKAECLVCVMSGMAWVAATTRTPVFIVGNQIPKDIAIPQISGYQTLLFSQNYLELIENIRKYKDDRDFYDNNCLGFKHEC